MIVSLLEYLRLDYSCYLARVKVLNVRMPTEECVGLDIDRWPIFFLGDHKRVESMEGYLELLGGQSEEVKVLLFNASSIHAILSVKELHNIATSTSHCAIIPTNRNAAQTDHEQLFSDVPGGKSSKVLVIQA